jgi:hypothetical protein
VRHNERTRTSLVVAIAAVTLTACGGHTADNGARTANTAPAAAAGTAPGRDYTHYYPPGTHAPSQVAQRVITAWADELRAGHVRRAAAYFAVPVIVQNATPPLRLANRREVLEFNRTLPCGAHVVRVIAGRRYTVATFVLTERPGSDGCGATGKLAATAFLLRHGKISEWRRVLVPPPLGPPENLRQGVPES